MKIPKTGEKLKIMFKTFKHKKVTKSPATLKKIISFLRK